MNRTIKFRGKRVDNGEWVYGDLVINQRTQTYRIFTDFANVRHGSYTDSGLHECSGELYHINPTTIGQFTGELDRNGKEIYEGDFFKLGSDKDIYEVRFEHCCFLAYKEDKQFGLVGELKNIFLLVIGNIHDK